MAELWGDGPEAAIDGQKLGQLLELYAREPEQTAPYLSKHMSNANEPLSCFVGAEARQQLEDPDGRPIEWTDPGLSGCEAISPFDICFPGAIRPVRLSTDQCP